MKNRKQRLILVQTDRKLEPYKILKGQIMPDKGWIYTIRKALGMSLRQLGERIGKTAQSVQDFEKREENGTITIQSLKEIAGSLDLQLVYALIPKDASLEALVLKQANSKANEIVDRTNTTMQLEDQGNTKDQLTRAKDQKVHELMNEMPRFLWD